MSSLTDQSTFDVRRAHWERDQEALSLVRIRVFVNEQGVPEDLEWDGADAQAAHLLAFDPSERPIGTARLLRSGQIGCMALLPEWRHRRVETGLLHEALNLADGPGWPTPFIHVQTGALSFYQSHGFRERGPELWDARIPHRLMTYRRKP